MGQGGAVKEVWGVAGGAVAFGAAVADEGSLQKQRAGLMVIGKGIAVLLPVVLDLVRDGGGVFLDELGNGLEGHALPRQSSITLRSSKVRCLFFLGFDFLAICVASFLRNNFPDSIQPQMTYQSKSHFKSHCGTYFGNLHLVKKFGKNVKRR